MARRSVPQHESPRVERLVRSLVGVTDLHITWADGALANVHILRDAAVQNHQIVRNVLSGIRAGFGASVESERVFIHDTEELFRDATGARDPGPSSAQPQGSVEGVEYGAPPRPGSSPVNGNGRSGSRKSEDNVNGNGNGRGHMAEPRQGHPAPEPPARTATTVRSSRKRAQPQAPMPATQAGHAGTSADASALVPEGVQAETTVLQLERMDVERNTSLLRCRAVLAGNGIRYSAIAETPYSRSAEAELAARVTLDAMRAGSLTTATLDGVSQVTIGSTVFITVAVRDSAASAPRAGTAMLVDSMAWAAGLAVLDAVGRLEPEASGRRTTAPVR